MEEEYGKIEGEIEDVRLDLVIGDDHSNRHDVEVNEDLFKCS